MDKKKIEYEIILLEDKKKKLSKGLGGILATGIILLFFAGIGIIPLIFYFIKKSKISKIDEQIEDYHRQIRLR